MNLVDQKIVFYFESNLKIDLVIKKLFFKNGSRVDLVDTACCCGRRWLLWVLHISDHR